MVCPWRDPRDFNRYVAMENAFLMLDYSDLPEYLLDAAPADEFVDALIIGCANALQHWAAKVGADPIAGLALELHPERSFIELSAHCAQGLPPMPVSDWNHSDLTSDECATDHWQPVRDALVSELAQWRMLSEVHPKAGPLYIYTILTFFVFNLDNEPLRSIVYGLPGNDSLHIFAVNYSDPETPNIFEIENNRTTLRAKKKSPPARAKNDEPKGPQVFPDDPRQGSLF